jgi:phosphoglucomutase
VAPDGGLKVITKSRWLAACPSGAEDLYTIYAKHCHGAKHLTASWKEAQIIVDPALGAPKPWSEILSGTNPKKRQ